VKLFLYSHHKYDYDHLYDESISINKEKNETTGKFHLSFNDICYRFHLKDQPSEYEFLNLFPYLFSLANEQRQITFDKEVFDYHEIPLGSFKVSSHNGIPPYEDEGNNQDIEMMSEDLIEDSIHLGISTSNKNIDSLGGFKSIFEVEQVACVVIGSYHVNEV
jgi:hypothetical protein